MARRFTIIIAALLLLSGCETFQPVPQGYSGPTALVGDSVKPLGRGGADIFYVAKFNGQAIGNSRDASRAASQGRGFNMRTVGVMRKIPAQPATLTIVGRRDYAAPILALANKIYEVSGDIHLTPMPDDSYIVKGELGDNYSAVWLENEKTGAVVGNKIEIHGSATLGFFEK